VAEDPRANEDRPTDRPTEIKPPGDSPGEPQDPWSESAETQLHPVTSDETRYDLPRTDVGAEDPPRWSARAGVPVNPPRTAQPAQDWEERPEPQPGGVWWMPILIGLVVLVLLGLIGLGLWLALRASGGGSPAASASATAPTSAAASPTPPSPTPSPTPTAASPTANLATIPSDIVGKPSDDARAELNQLGITATITTKVSGDYPPGTVIGSDPNPGSQVPVGTQITLIVAAAPSPTPTDGASSAAPNASHS
jgi:cytoskeletal protein RodZ